MKQPTIPKYKPYRLREIKSDFKKMLSLSEAEIKQLAEEWNQVEKENDALRHQYHTECNEYRQQLMAVLRVWGFEPTTGKKSTKGWFKSMLKEWHVDDWDRYRPEKPYWSMCDKPDVDGIKLYLNSSHVDLIECYTELHHQYDRQLERKKYDEQLFVKSMEIAIKQGYNIVGLTHDQVIQTVDYNERDQWRINNPMPPHCDHERYSVTGDVIKGFEWTLGDDW